MGMLGTDWPHRLAIGYVIAYFSFFPFIRRHRTILRADPYALAPEARLYWLLYSEYIHDVGSEPVTLTALEQPRRWKPLG